MTVTNFGDNFEIEEDSNGDYVVTYTPTDTVIERIDSGDEEKIFEVAAQISTLKGSTSGATVYDDATKTVGDGTTSAEHESVNVESLSNVRIVGPNGYSSVQAAHDDLPSDGGMILLTEGIAEANITISKPARLVGTGAAARNGGSESPAVIDTSGGAGVTINKQGAALEDIMIDGDGNGSDGVTVTAPGINLKNVEVRSKGGNGLVLDGDVQSGHFDVTVANVNGIGARLVTGGGSYVSDNTFRLSCSGCGSDGIRVTDGGLFAGNVFTRTHSVGNTGWGVQILGDNGFFAGNTFEGYGFENNTAGSLNASGERPGGPSNTLVIGEANSEIDTVSGYWNQFAVTEPQTPVGVLGVATGEVSFGLQDDWGDGRLSGRRGGTTGRYVDHTPNPIPGYYRPHWTVEGGSPTTSAGSLDLPAGDTTTQKVTTDGEMTTGSFETTFAFDSIPSSGGLQPKIINDASAAEYYNLSVGGDGSVVLASFATGSFDEVVVSGSWTPDTNEHTITAERDSAGNWELFFDSVSQGTGTDSNLPTEPDRPEIFSTADSSVEVRSVDWR